MSNYIYFRGVNVKKIIEKYFRGEYQNVTDAIPFPKEALVQSSNEDSQIVTFSDPIEKTDCEISFGSGLNFACVGHRVGSIDGSYERYNPSSTEGLRCMNCLLEISDKQENNWGIPVKRSVCSDKYIYTTIDIFCSPECTFFKLNERLNNTIYSRSMEFFSEMYEMWTGKKFSELKSVSDPRLLKIFNGPLTWEEYHKSDGVYTEKPSNVYMYPAIEYLSSDK